MKPDLRLVADHEYADVRERGLGVNAFQGVIAFICLVGVALFFVVAVAVIVLGLERVAG